MAWAGTAASANDEWIELWNPSGGAVNLAGWMLTDGGDIHIYLSGTIDSGGFFLLERTDDTTVRDIPADIIYAGSLSNSGEGLSLYDSLGRLVDSANADGGFWPAGSVADYAAMERANAGPPTDGNWCTNAGLVRNGQDASGNPIHGTPRMPFSGSCLQSANTPTPTATFSPTAETVTPTPSPTATSFRLEYPPLAVVINEVAWAGTSASSSDEWIELYNPGLEPVDLSGWFLTDDGDIHILLGGWIPAGGYFLLERGDDQAVSDIPANQIYTGGLLNGGEGLQLIDPSGHVVDFAGAGGSNWPAGTASPEYATMERMSLNPAGWATNNGWMRNGRDSQGQLIRGTPDMANSALFPTPTPTALPKGILINEFLPKPGSDWNGDGNADLGDEFIELINTGEVPVDLTGWILDDVRKGGSRGYTIPNGVVLQPGQLWVFFRKKTRISLNDGGDEVWLLAPDETKMDGIVYTRTRWPDSAWNRYPDGESVLRLGFPPTPREKNQLPPELLRTPRKTPLLPLEGWREVDCEEDGPIVLGDGALTTGDESSFRMAENTGWLTWEEGGCFAWTAPRTYDGDPAVSLWMEESAGDYGVGWWWEAWFLR